MTGVGYCTVQCQVLNSHYIKKSIQRDKKHKIQSMCIYTYIYLKKSNDIWGKAGRKG